MEDKILQEFINELIKAEETAKEARKLVCEHMEKFGIKSVSVPGYNVTFTASGTRTAYAKGYSGTKEYKAAKAAMDAAKAPYAYTTDRAAYVTIKESGAA